MELSKETKIAVRAARRLLDTIDAQYAEAYSIEAQWDGGEWSGPALNHSQSAANNRAVAGVAGRYNIRPSTLWHHICNYEYGEMRYVV